MRSGRPRTVDWEAARRLRAEGLSYPQIAKVLGVSHTTVLYACDEEFRERHCAANRDRAAARRRA